MNFNFQGKKGFDVSFYQDANSTPQKIDFNKMKAWGADFVIIRAGQRNWIDEDFLYNWQAAKNAGLLRSAYWFYDPRETPTKQAQLFTDLFANDPPEGRLWADFEFPAAWGGGYANWTYWKTFMDLISVNHRTGIYTADWWWKPYAVNKGADVNYFGRFPLWVAQYTSDPFYVVLPKGWMRAMIWQDGTPSIGSQVGVESKEIDHNQWNSDYNFETEWGTNSPPTDPPPTGGSMFYVKVNTSAGLNMRKGAGTSYAKVGALQYNDEIEYDIKQSGWLHIIRARHAGSPALLSSGQPVDGSDSWVSDSYVVTISKPSWANESDPPPATGITITSVTVYYTENGVPKSETLP